jgi:hypothetical protein
MTTFPRSPCLVKGAIVAVDRFNPLASVVGLKMWAALFAGAEMPAPAIASKPLNHPRAPRHTVLDALG